LYLKANQGSYAMMNIHFQTFYGLKLSRMTYPGQIQAL